jgi:hypothetical protein
LSPPERLREELEAARSRGEAFEEAWPRARRLALDGAVQRDAWAEALRATRTSWEQAYHRRGSRRLRDAHLALELVELHACGDGGDVRHELVA